MKNMKYVLTLTALISAQPAFATEFSYPLLGTYKAQAQALIEKTEAAQSVDDLAALATATDELIQTGARVMELFASKNPSCAEQYKVFIDEIPAMTTLSFQAANERYHDGVGLPAAPRLCYLARAQVIHPALNNIRLRDGWSEETRQANAADFEEVIEHLDRIQKYLDQPLG